MNESFWAGFNKEAGAPKPSADPKQLRDEERDAEGGGDRNRVAVRTGGRDGSKIKQKDKKLKDGTRIQGGGRIHVGRN